MGTLINQELYKIFKKKSSIIIPIIIFILMIAMAVLSNNYEDILKPESQFKQGYTGFSWIFFLMIIQAATIITMEFHYGTIKNLLYRNYSRMSIILSKFSALFIYSLVLFIVTTLISLGLKLVLFSDMDILKQSGDNLSLLQEHLIWVQFKIWYFLKEIAPAGTKKVDEFLSHFMPIFNLHINGQCLKKRHWFCSNFCF